MKILRALAMAAAVVTAGVSGSEAAEIKGDGGKFRLLYNQPGTNSYVPFVIKKFSLDKKYGIELVPVPTTTTPAAITAIQSGGAEAGTFGWNDIARMQAAGIQVVGVAPFLRWGADFIVVPADSSIKSLGDLKGKKVGTHSRTALNWIVMNTVAKRDFKIDVEKEAMVHEGAPPLLRALVEQGQLDATHMFNSVTPGMIVSGKFRVLAKISDLVNQYGLPDTPFLLYAVEGKYAAAHPNNVKAFVAAYQEAVEILNTNDEVWLERGKELKLADEASVMFRKEARTDIWKKFGSSTEADIRKIFDVFLPIAGAEVLGIDKLPAKFMTLEFQ